MHYPKQHYYASLPLETRFFLQESLLDPDFDSEIEDLTREFSHSQLTNH